MTPMLFPNPIAKTNKVIPGNNATNGIKEGINGVSKTSQANSWLLSKDSKIPESDPKTPR
jgi:hypothetical protein